MSLEVKSIELKEIVTKESKALEYEEKTKFHKWSISLSSFSNKTNINGQDFVIDAPGGVIGYQVWSHLGLDLGYFNVNHNEKFNENKYNQYKKNHATKKEIME